MIGHKHKILFMIAYVAMPIFMAWIGYMFSDFTVTKKAHPHNIHYGENGEVYEDNGATEDNNNNSDTSVYKSAENSKIKFYDLPRVSMSMSTSTGGSGTMKLDLSLEVYPADLHRVADFEPRIVEKILLFMRQQSFEDLQKPGGERVLRKALEHEIRSGAFPIQVAAVDVRRMVFE